MVALLEARRQEIAQGADDRCAATERDLDNERLELSAESVLRPGARRALLDNVKRGECRFQQTGAGAYGRLAAAAEAGEDAREKKQSEERAAERQEWARHLEMA